MFVGRIRGLGMLVEFKEDIYFIFRFNSMWYLGEKIVVVCEGFMVKY